ncbi:hypothetical protein DL96DRAFT_1738896 [Flagelloscypha sp. PMI_526]|nr:hypothetical protein DL96DRAFT_1738896 [Flagelloscypha sp. PMI_526]
METWKRASSYNFSQARSMAKELPSELLSYIFRFYRDDILSTIDCSSVLIERGEDPAYHETGECPFPWLTPSAVCAKWRAAALGCGQLWNILHLNSLSATKELLRRSKTSSLIVGRKAEDFSSPHVFEACLAQALEHSHRIKSLDISPLQKSEWSSLPIDLARAFESAAFPCLQVLRVGFRSSSVYDQLSFGCLVVHRWLELVVRKLLSSPSCSLMELHLTQMPATIVEYLNLPLRRLVLTGAGANVDIHVVEDTLRNLHQLESLTLQFSTWDPDDTTTTQAIPLPRLNEMNIEACPLLIIHFLTCIAAKPATLSIRVSKDNHDPGYYESILRTIDAVLPWIVALPTLLHTSYAFWDDCTQMQFSSNSISPPITVIRDPFLASAYPGEDMQVSSFVVSKDCNLNFFFDAYDVPLHSTIIKSFNTFLLSVQSASFYLHGYPDLSPLWIEMSSRLPAVETLTVSFSRNYHIGQQSSSGRDIGHILAASDLTESSNQIPYSHLETLVLFQANFKRAGGPCIGSTDLFSLLKNRALQAEPLLKLVLVDCFGITDDRVASDLAPLAEVLVQRNAEEEEGSGYILSSVEDVEEGGSNPDLDFFDLIEEDEV